MYMYIVSHPRQLARAHFSMPFGSSNLPGAGPILPDGADENWPYAEV